MTISDVLLERFLSDDLPAQVRDRVVAALAADPSLQARLAALKTERAAFLRSDPPALFAHRVATVVAVRKAARPSWQRWLLPLGTALAMSLVGLNLLRLYRTDTYLAGKELAAESPEQTGASPPPAWKPAQEPPKSEKSAALDGSNALGSGTADKGARGQAEPMPVEDRFGGGGLGGGGANKAKKELLAQPSPRAATKESQRAGRQEDEHDAIADAKERPAAPAKVPPSEPTGEARAKKAEAKRDAPKASLGASSDAPSAADATPRSPAPPFAAPPSSPPSAPPSVAQVQPSPSAGPADGDASARERRFAPPPSQAPAAQPAQSAHASRSRAQAESKDAADDVAVGGKGGALAGSLSEEAQSVPPTLAATFDFGPDTGAVTATQAGAVSRRVARPTSASVRVSVPEPNRLLTLLAFDGKSLSTLGSFRPRVGTHVLPGLRFNQSQSVFVVLHAQPLDLAAIERALRAKQRPAFGAPALQLNVLVQP